MNQSLKHREFVELLAKKGYTKKDAKQIVDDFIVTLMECMAAGDEIHFHGFGTFSVIEVDDRESVDMQTQERIVIPGHSVPKFSAGKSLRRAVRDGFVRE